MNKISSNSIGVVGSGSWATAMVKMLTDSHADKTLYWWVRKEQDIQYINTYKHNPSYLTAVEIKVDPAFISSDIRFIFQHSDVIILNTPAAYLKDALTGLTAEDFEGKIIITAIKGIIPDENLIVDI